MSELHANVRNAKGNTNDQEKQQAYSIIVTHLKNILFYDYNGPKSDKLLRYKNEIVDLLMELNNSAKTLQGMRRWEYKLADGQVWLGRPRYTGEHQKQYPQDPWGGTLLDTPENKMFYDIELEIKKCHDAFCIILGNDYEWQTDLCMSNQYCVQTTR